MRINSIPCSFNYYNDHMVFNYSYINSFVKIFNSKFDLDSHPCKNEIIYLCDEKIIQFIKPYQYNRDNKFSIQLTQPLYYDSSKVKKILDIYPILYGLLPKKYFEESIVNNILRYHDYSFIFLLENDITIDNFINAVEYAMNMKSGKEIYDHLVYCYKDEYDNVFKESDNIKKLEKKIKLFS